jgi:16S rRNA (guanine527-N7)-methyltransferase
MDAARARQLADALQADAMALGVALDAAQRDRLIAYLALIAKWNGVYNLTAIREPDAMLTQHIVDSLAIVPIVERLMGEQAAQGRAAPRLLDVGSGAGLPGIVLACVLPQLAVTCIDTVGKKAAFMRQAKGALGLANLAVEEGRVEQLAPPAPDGYELITSRAFATVADFIAVSGHLLAEGGVFVAMKGTHPQEELQALQGPWQVRAVLPLQVPRLAAQRHLAIVGRDATRA